jgi:hypothetical protein
MQKITTTFTVIAMTLVFVSCGKTSKELEENQNLKVKNQNEIVAILNQASDLFDDINVKSVTIDMTELPYMEIHAENIALEKAINRISNQSTAHDKRLRVDLNKIIARAGEGPARLHYGFYYSTQNRAQPANAPARKNSDSDNALIIVEDGGRLHFVGPVPTSAVFNFEDFENLLNNVPRRAPIAKRGTGDDEEFYSITADRIVINTHAMYEDGWAILEYIVPDTLSGWATNPTIYHGYKRNITNRLPRDRKTPFINAQTVTLTDADAKEMQMVEFGTLNENNPDAIIHFRENPRINFTRADTVHMGGTWINGVYTLHSESWGQRANEGHFGHADNLNRKFSFTARNNDRLTIKVPTHKPGVNDSAFFHHPMHGAYAWISVEELIEFLAGRETASTGGNFSDYVRFSGRVAVKIPTDAQGNIISPSVLFPHLGAGAASWDVLFEWVGLDAWRPGFELRTIATVGLQVKTR